MRLCWPSPISARIEVSSYDSDGAPPLGSADEPCLRTDPAVHHHNNSPAARKGLHRPSKGRHKGMVEGYLNIGAAIPSTPGSTHVSDHALGGSAKGSRGSEMRGQFPKFAT
jgi:hypothetical protein